MTMHRVSRYLTLTGRHATTPRHVTEERIAALIGPTVPYAVLPHLVRTLIESRDALTAAFAELDKEEQTSDPLPSFLSTPRTSAASPPPPPASTPASASHIPPAPAPASPPRSLADVKEAFE